MIADFMELESYGLEIVKTKKTGDVRNMLEIQVRPTAEFAGRPAQVVESRWIESLALSGESFHTLLDGPPQSLRFATKGMPGFITGTITVQERA